MSDLKNVYGELIETTSVSVFFGNINSQDYTLNENIQFGHQVHKADLKEVDFYPSASAHFIDDSDGLFTRNSKVKIGVYTADCVPCFIYNNDTLISLHLGWRSIHLGLFEKAIMKLSKDHETQIFIGPHIQENSFEVGEEVFRKFEVQMISSSLKNWFTKLPKNKYKLSLLRILQHKAAPFNPEFFCSKVDTFTSESHCSYRRQSQTRLRNISFAFLK